MSIVSTWPSKPRPLVSSAMVIFPLEPYRLSHSPRTAWKPFAPEDGVADEHDQLKFVTSLQNRPDYFVLEHMQEAYDAIPAYINGTYFFANKKMQITLGLVKNRHP